METLRTAAPQQLQPFQPSALTKLLGINKQALAFPLSSETVRERLRVGLANSFAKNQGFWSVKEEYSGQLVGDTLLIELIFRHSRGPMKYLIHGQLRTDASGTILQLIIRERYPWGFFFAPCCGYLFALLFCLNGSQGQSPLQLVATVIVAGTIVATILGIIAYGAAKMWRNTATTSALATLQQMIASPTNHAHN